VSISGKFLTAAVNGVNIDGTHEWSVAESGDRLEATTGANNGRGKKDVGCIDTRIRVVFYLDISTGLFTFIRTGAVLTDLQLFHNIVASAPLYQIASATVFDATVRGQIRDRMIVEADIEANGDVVTATDPG
jgi:hypothetical protein